MYFDCELGGAAISADLNLVAYVAEKKRPKKEPFFKAREADKEEVCDSAACCLQGNLTTACN